MILFFSIQNLEDPQKLVEILRTQKIAQNIYNI